MSARERCQFCPRVFNSRRGAALHERRAHEAAVPAIAPRDKVPRWTQTEDDILIEAEANVRYSLDLPENEYFFSSNYVELNNLILDYIVSKYPTFRRSKEAISCRRKWKHDKGHLEAVIMRKNDIILARQNMQAVDGSNIPASLSSNTSAPSIDDAASQQREESSLSAMITDIPECRCKGALFDAIKAHIELLKTRPGTSDRANFLEAMLSNLNNFSSADFSNALRNSKDNNKVMSVSAVFPTVRLGARQQARAAETGKVRSILDEQGHKRCLQYLRNPTSSGLCSLETVELFKQVFEDEGAGVDTEDVDLMPRGDTHGIHSPIRSSEVVEQLKRLQKNTAPGPDGLRKEALQDMDPEDLACLFNIFLHGQNVPKELKLNKTTMIPKSAEPGAGDWRPITVASIVDRLFAKVLEARVSRTLQLNPDQRGFIRDLDGCGENLTAYSGALKYARARGKSLLVTSLDLAKAFDSVRYSTITRSLHRLGVDDYTVELLRNYVDNQETLIKYQEGTMKVKLNKGVRQGWPLSPVLFLAVVDELLHQLKDADGFHIKNDFGDKGVLTGIAFADDLILFSSSELGMKRHLDTAVNWCNKRGMRINPKKSTVLHLRSIPKMKKAFVSTSDFSVYGEKIPCVSDSFERVLGVHIHHTGKVDHKLDSLGRC